MIQSIQILKKLRKKKDIEEAKYVWTKHGRISDNVKTDNDILVIEPFNRESIGTYQCLAFNLDNGKLVLRRINLNAENKAKPMTKPVSDVSDRIQISVLSDQNEFVRGGTVRLKCFIGDFFYL